MLLHPAVASFAVLDPRPSISPSSTTLAHESGYQLVKDSRVAWPRCPVTARRSITHSQDS